MSKVTYNPYPLIGTQLTAGFNSIIAGLPAGSTVDTLVDKVAEYITATYYAGSGTVTQIEIKSVAYNIINVCNSNINWATYNYNAEQINIIQMLVGQRTLTATPINSLDNWFANITEAIGNSKMTISQQAPLLLGLQIAQSAFSYWKGAVTTPGSWSTYFESVAYKNYVNIGLWTVASIYGALIGANASQKGLIAPTSDITSVTIISALTGALAFGAGKVAFKWVPEIQVRDLVTSSGQYKGGFSDAIDMGNPEPLFETTNNCGSGSCINKECTNNQCTNKGCKPAFTE